MHEDDLITIPFPDDTSIVYVLSFNKPGKIERIPFYVGQSGRGTRRIGEYISAQFAASTDFKVGVAVKTLKANSCEVFVSYCRSDNRKEHEARSISKYKAQGYKLLNHEPSYNYRAASKAAQQAKIESYVSALLQNPSAPSASGDA